MSNHQILVEEPSLSMNVETLEVKNNTENNVIDYKELHNLKNNPNEINLIFRNQLSKDTILLINKSKIKTINDLINLLFEELKISPEDKYIRLFFKGRPLRVEENLVDISNYLFLLIIINIFKL